MIKEERDWIFGMMRKPEKKDQCIVILSSDEDDGVYVKMEQPMDIAIVEVESKGHQTINKMNGGEEELSTLWATYEESSNSYDYEYSCEMYNSVSPDMQPIIQQAQPERIQKQRQIQSATPHQASSHIKLEPSPSQSAKRVLLQRLAEKLVKRSLKMQ